MMIEPIRMKPWIVRFGQRLINVNGVDGDPEQFDAERQIDPKPTSFTKVRLETTDDD